MVASPSETEVYKKLLHSIKGLNVIVNKSVISTTIFRVSERWEFTSIIVDMYGWLHASKRKEGVVRMLARNQPCPELFEFIERRIERINSSGKFKVVLH